MADGFLAASPDATGASSTAGLGGRLLLRQRLIAFHRFGFLMGAALVVVINLTLIPRGQAFALNSLASPANLASLLLVLGFAVLWVLIRQFELSFSALRRVDAIGTLVLCLLIVIRGCLPDRMQHSQFTSILAITNVLLFRAVALPSPPLRTFGIGLASTAPVGVAVLIGRLTPVEWTGPMANTLMGEHAAVFLIWTAVAVIVSTAASGVIYGLRRTVSQARRLGQYTLEEKLGEGAMGEVYRARHALLRRPTAIKLLKPGSANDDVLRRFEREVQQTARLTHPNTIAIYDYGRTPDETFYYAMEYLDGLDLQSLVERFGSIPPGRVIHILRQIASSLSEAHGLGLIHRDIKPANVILCERGGVYDTVKVVDFGLVKDVSDKGLNATVATAITGTPLYLSPESIRTPDKIAGSADLYALGAVGYLLTTGKGPFDAGSIGEILNHHLNTPAPRASERLGRAVPPDLEEILMACMAKDPKDRPRGGQDLVMRLDACVDARSWTLSDAESWWSDYRSDAPAHPVQLQKPNAERDDSEQSVLAVDLNAAR